MDTDPTGVATGRWEPGRAPPGRWRMGLVVALLMAAAVAGGAAWMKGWRPFTDTPPKPPPTAAEFRDGAMKCMKARDLNCAEANWAEYVRQRPIDGHGIASLAIVLNWRDKHEQAVVQFQKAIDGGEGSYDLFAYYADSLGKLGRIDEAIDWYYRALSVYPALVDVRSSLAKLLVNRQRLHEGLALLQAFDADAEAHGRMAHFAGQRIAIEGLIQRGGAVGADAGTARPLRLPKQGGHYFVPVTMGSARSEPFVVDTGASVTAISRRLLQASKAEHRVVNAEQVMVTADGRRVKAQVAVLARLLVGPFELKNVQVVVCDGCVSLLGQSSLAHFDMQSSRVQGVEFLTLTRRGSAPR